MTSDHGAIEERLESLERQNRRIKLAGLAALVIAGAVVLTGLAWPRGSASGQAGKSATVIRATEFVLVDAQGRTRAALEMYMGGPELVLYDANGKLRARLDVSPDGQGLRLYDANEKARAVLNVIADQPGLAVSDANGKMGAVLSVLADGPVLSLNDAQGFATQIGVTGLVTPATAETRKTSAASIVMFSNDKEHHVLWKAPPQN